MMPQWLQPWGEGWRWLIYGVLIAIIPFSSLFLIGLYVLKMTPWRWWRSVYTPGPPEAYDGKEPYEQWAKKMSAAREAQRREEG
mgnify:CR=1 FL=1